MKPGILTLITGVALFFLGACAIPLLVVLPLIFEKSTAVHFKAPGTIEVPVEGPGRYYLWNDFQTVYKGKSYDRSKSIPDGMEIRIWNANGDLLEFVSDSSISSCGDAGGSNSIGYVTIKSPGKVKIEIAGGNEERIFSFARSRFLKIFSRVAGGFLLSMLGVLGGLGMITWGIVKLVTTNKRVKEPAAPNGGPPPVS